MVLEWLAPVLDLVSDVGTNIANFLGIKNTNETNQQIHQNDNDFQAHQTQLAWERDDTAHQREVADLEAAGLSPLANTTGSQVTSPLGAASPIAAQAPQFSATSAINSMIQAQQIAETKRHNQVQEGLGGLEYVNQCKEIELKTKELDIENKKVNETISYNAKYLKQLADTLSETTRHNKDEEKLKALQYESEQYWKEINQQTGGICNYVDYYDYDKYEAAMKAWTNDFTKFVDNLSETSKSKSESYSSSFDGSLGINGGVSPKASIGVNGAIGSGESQSGSSSENISKKQEAQMQEFYRTHPMPVFHYFKAEHKD